jgi:hypothetical protein
MIIGDLGKSNFCNKLVGENFFKSESSSESGVTKEISFLKRPALGKKGATMLNVAEIPGLCDIEIPLACLINEIQTKIGYLPFDAVLIVIKLSDYRASLSEVVAMKFIKRIMEKVET